MNRYFYKNLILIVLVAILIGVFIFVIMPRSVDPEANIDKSNVVINNNVIFVEIADTSQKQWQGLSGKESLGKNEGMLFIFPNTQPRTFVMRNMKFPIDIIWIKDNKILKIDKNLPPEGEIYLERYSSIYEVNYVLEVNEGFTDKNNIKVGDEIIFKYVQ